MNLSMAVRVLEFPPDRRLSQSSSSLYVCLYTKLNDRLSHNLEWTLSLCFHGSITCNTFVILLQITYILCHSVGETHFVF